MDQNVLSDMRSRRLLKTENSTLLNLKSICEEKNITVLYSNTHLDEISQISQATYRQEHILTLSELEAVYISPNDGEDESTAVINVWERYLENNYDNEASGANDLYATMDLQNRKLSGLPIRESFQEINELLKERLYYLLSKALCNAKNINLIELSLLEQEELSKQIINMEEQLENLPNLPTLEIPSSQSLGPKPFRKCSLMKHINFENMPISEVIPTIEDIFTVSNSSFNWEDYFSKSYSDQISRCYTLMNWAGYYADDFGSHKKKKDRFRASTNDAAHVSNAISSTHLISNDKAFLMKAAVCYHHINLDISVCNPKDALLDIRLNKQKD